MPDARFEAGVPFSDQDIERIEQVIGRKLPSDYIAFVKTYGGAFVGGCVDGKAELSILRFFDANDNTGVLRCLAWHTDFRDDGVLPFADCELGNLYVLDTDGAVHYVNYYGGRTNVKKITDQFQDFVARIVVEET